MLIRRFFYDPLTIIGTSSNKRIKNYPDESRLAVYEYWVHCRGF